MNSCSGSTFGRKWRDSYKKQKIRCANNPPRAISEASQRFATEGVATNKVGAHCSLGGVKIVDKNTVANFNCQFLIASSILQNLLTTCCDAS